MRPLESINLIYLDIINVKVLVNTMVITILITQTPLYVCLSLASLWDSSSCSTEA